MRILVEREPSGREALAAVAILVAAFAATQLDWAAVTSSCANTAVTRGFAEYPGENAWPWLYVIGFALAAGSVVVAGRIGAAIAVGATLLAALSTGALMNEVLAPFEARPAPGKAVLCQLDLATGAWLATAALALAIGIAVVRVRRPAPAPRGRVVGAAIAALVAAAYALGWIPFLVDAVIDVASPLGWIVLGAIDLAIGVLVGRAVLGAASRGAAVDAALAWVGGALALGPLALFVMRAAGLARGGAAILADWEEPNGLMGPFVVGTLALAGAVLWLIGFARSRRKAAVS